MAKAESCHNCVYSRWDRNLAMWTMGVGMPVRPTCGNQPDYPGRMKECPLGRICNNFRVRPPVPKGETVKTITLGDGFVVYVDAADFEWLNQWTWHLCGRYAGRLEKKKVIFMHRAIMQAPEGTIIDHKNRNKLDNTRDNLRTSTHRENAYNQPKRRGTSSQFRGVSRRKKSGKYHAQICYEGEQLFLGLYTDEIEAARAHDYKAVELFGDEARLNFPEEWPEERRRAVAKAKVKNQKAKGQSKKEKGRDREPHAQRATHNAGRAASRGRGQRTARTKNKKAHAETQGRRVQRRKTKSERATGHEALFPRQKAKVKRQQANERNAGPEGSGSV